jgi:hypothetical protein
MESFVLWGSQNGSSLVCFELILDTELFAEPDDAL